MEPHYFHTAFNQNPNCFLSLALCLLLSAAYLGALHVWNSPYSRDHPTTIKKRFFSVFVMLFIAPCFLYIGIHKSILEKHSIYELLGLKLQGLCQAILLPLFLTVILFLGPISMELFSGFSRFYIDPSYQDEKSSANLIWIRNHIVAPFSEEFAYRSCMMPLLLQCFSPINSVLINPLLFGLCHLHHLHERLKFKSMDLKSALIVSCFQFVFTSLFGMYSAYLFMRTGHFMSIFVVHAFCNLMGFPIVTEISSYAPRKRNIVIALYITGFVLWMFLVKRLTEPTWYYNDIVWTV